MDDAILLLLAGLPGTEPGLRGNDDKIEAHGLNLHWVTRI